MRKRKGSDDDDDDIFNILAGSDDDDDDTATAAATSAAVATSLDDGAIGNQLTGGLGVDIEDGWMQDMIDAMGGAGDEEDIVRDEYGRELMMIDPDTERAAREQYRSIDFDKLSREQETQELLGKLDALSGWICMYADRVMGLRMPDVTAPKQPKFRL